MPSFLILLMVGPPLYELAGGDGSQFGLASAALVVTFIASAVLITITVVASARASRHHE
jgi:hypothetical protein